MKDNVERQIEYFDSIAENILMRAYLKIMKSFINSYMTKCFSTCLNFLPNQKLRYWRLCVGAGTEKGS